MKVILLEKIPRVGDLGDMVSVKPGFGRNFLIPQGKALPATPSNVETFNARRAELEAQAAEKLSELKQRADKLTGVQVSIAMNVGVEGKLFGSVGRNEIVHALSEKGHQVAKAEVRLDSPIRELGDHEIVVSLLGEEVSTTIQVSIIAA